MKLLAKALVEDQDFDLQLELVAGESGLTRELGPRRVQKTGLALAGFVESVRPNSVQVLGRTEMAYLRQLGDPERHEAMLGVVDTALAALVLASDQAAPAELAALADSHGLPLLRTPLVSGEIIRRLERFLDAHLSPELSLHGVFLDVFGVGVMLSGPSGVGKSECALDLILRGHRLVADDIVLVRRRGRHLEGTGSELTRHHMEIRGLGILNIQDLFGSASVRERKRLEVLAELTEWRSDAEYDRLGIDDQYETILEVPVSKLRLPIRPGRNVASIVEVAARNHLLKLQGRHAARSFKETLERRLASGNAEG